MAAYIIAQLRVDDVETYRRYALQVAETVKPYGGRLLVANDAVGLEGTQPYPRTVIGEFPGLETARAWYESAEYQAIRPLRTASTAGTIFIVEGMTLPRTPHRAGDEAGVVA